MCVPNYLLWVCFRYKKKNVRAHLSEWISWNFVQRRHFFLWIRDNPGLNGLIFRGFNACLILLTIHLELSSYFSSSSSFMKNKRIIICFIDSTCGTNLGYLRRPCNNFWKGFWNDNSLGSELICWIVWFSIELISQKLSWIM